MNLCPPRIEDWHLEVLILTDKGDRHSDRPSFAFIQVHEEMKVFYRTFDSEAILREGFQDAESRETGQIFKGVWVSADAPLDIHGDADGDVVLCLEIPDRLFEEYEWVEEDLECRMYRESFIPAAELNRYPIQIWNEEA